MLDGHLERTVSVEFNEPIKYDAIGISDSVKRYFMSVNISKYKYTINMHIHVCISLKNTKANLLKAR